MSLTDAFSAFGSGVQDLFASAGYAQQAAGYTQAAAMEDTNAKLAAASTVVQKAMARRSIEKAVGGQRSDVLGAGFSFSGSAIDLAADTVGQGALSTSLIENQGAIDVQGYKIEALSYRTQAQAAQSQASASAIGGFLNIGLGILSLFSDERLKENIVRVGTGIDGLPLYEFNYRGGGPKFRGYMAQEVVKVHPEAVTDAVVYMGVSERFRSERVL
jgi:hypothetical protein